MVDKINRAAITQNGVTTTYTYDANNRLLTESKAGDVILYQYDANGNTLRAVRGGDGVGAYTYNLFGNQVSYTPTGVVFTSYTYRPDGLRHSIGDTIHLWDGANIVADIEENDVTTYVRGLTLLYANDGDETYYHFNAHGDVIALTDEDGVKEKSYSYNAFGVEENSSSLDDNPFRYCGEYYDKVSETIYLRARYYDAAQGRFTQQDDWEYISLSDLLSLNLYIYCFNNPVNRIDPCGNFSWKTMFAVGATIAIVGIALLMAIPTGGGSLVLAGGGITTATAATAANAVVVTGLAITSASLVAGGIEESGLNFKTSKKSDKERSTDKPSWVNKGHVDYSQTALENVTRIMNEKFGPGNWTKSTAEGAFSKIFKWLTRHIGLK